MLTRWDPFTEFTRLSNDLFSAPATRRETFTPAVDIFEDAEALTLKAEVPGLKSEEVDIDVEKNVLTLRGERKLEKKETKDAYQRIERSHGRFARSFVLPDTVDAEKIDAKLVDGILTVRLPKRPAEVPRRITVKAS